MINLKDEKLKIRPTIVQCGTGATGSLIVQMLSQMLASYEIDGNYLICDPDYVETKNLTNQLFIPKDVGLPKAEVLAKRYRAAYQQKISAYTEGFVEDIETLKELFEFDYDFSNYSCYRMPILIGAVDNNYSRQIFHEFFEQSETLLYIDVGNEGTTVPEDWQERRKEEWTAEELERFNSSGYSGQVVQGLKIDGKTILEPVAAVFPDILEDKDELRPSLSCSQLIVSNPQKLITNRFASLAVMGYLNEVFDTNSISNHITHFHAKKGYMRSVSVPNKEDN